MNIAEVIQADVLATWQDLGRVRSTHHGVGQGGSMDIQAACWANRLLNQDINVPLIEITMGLFALEFKTTCQIAITGADMEASLNNRPIKVWQTHLVSSGDQLRFKMAKQGLRSYLAIAADIKLETAFESVSFVAREQFSGLVGRPLAVSDQLFGTVSRENKKFGSKQVPRSFVPDYSEPLSVELIPAYQFDRFPKSSIEALLRSEYEIQASSSRMAYLFQGDIVQHDIESLPSEGVAYGAVQIPPDGQPIILLNDRQTMGGYPKLGCISRLSGAALSQRFAPTKVKFELCSVELANSRLQEMLSFFRTAAV